MKTYHCRITLEIFGQNSGVTDRFPICEPFVKGGAAGVAGPSGG